MDSKLVKKDMIIKVNNYNYRIIKLLGKGKGGYSYLAEKDNLLFTLKQIHHEPCSYYQFNDKIGSEINAYKVLNNIGIPLPKLIDIDMEEEIIIKEYIEGKTILELVVNNKLDEELINEMKVIAKKCYDNNLNIDYFPTNFIVKDNTLFYIDYECNEYMEKWNFENWGIKYWSMTDDLKEYLRNLH